jgi:hypothetical protein
MSAPDGPYLYDEGPEALHTGTPRRRRGLLTALLVGTVAVALLMVVLLPLVTGSASTQAKQVTTVFLKALAAGDTETAYGLLCDTERQRLAPDRIAAAYVGPTPGTVTGVTEVEQGGTTKEQVDVRWSDGSTSRYTLVNQSGPRICATSPLR